MRGIKARITETSNHDLRGPNCGNDRCNLTGACMAAKRANDAHCSGERGMSTADVGAVRC